ncbi:MAG: MIP family channel protein [Chloroflexi bacterium]|nr:MIP family channel protein [Chloroflexota bacterium]
MLAEMIGTFALVLAGTGAVVSNAVSGGAQGHVGISLTFGLVIMVMIYATGHISGAHFNPAVTLAFALTRHFPAARVLPYLVAQVWGAIMGSLAVRFLIGNTGGLGVTHPSNGSISGMVLEGILTYLLMFVITAVATDTRAVGQAAAIAIGGTIALEALFAGPITGASMNPARSLGPALVAGDFTDLWLYLVGPIAGAALGALTYQVLRDPQAVGTEAKPDFSQVVDETK